MKILKRLISIFSKPSIEKTKKEHFINENIEEYRKENVLISEIVEIKRSEIILYCRLGQDYTKMKLLGCKIYSPNIYDYYINHNGQRKKLRFVYA